MAVFTTTFAPVRSRLLGREIDLVRITALRQLKVRYRGTALGVLWSFANPILMTLLYTAIFGAAFGAYYGSVARYLISAFVAVVVVTYFLQGVGEALPSIVANGGLLNKIAIPKHVFPLASVVANTFQQCVTTFPVVLVMTAVLTRDPIRVLVVAALLVAVVALTAGFAFAFSTLYVFFRDLPYIWSLIGFVLWLSSPVFYPAAFVSAQVRAWMAVNPVAVVMMTLRSVVVDRGPIAWSSVAAAIGVSLVVLVIGVALFRALRDDFMDLL